MASNSNGRPGGSTSGSADDELSDEWGEIDDLLQTLVLDVTEMPAEEQPPMDAFRAWMVQYQLDCYHDLLVENGFDNLNYMSEEIMAEPDLRRLGIRSQDDCSTLVAVASLLPDRPALDEPDTVPELLEVLGLGEYLQLFEEKDYMTMKKVCALWDNELSELGIVKLGHRRRLTSTIRELHMMNPMLHGDVKLPEMSDAELALRMRTLSMSRLIQLSKESSAPLMPETNVNRDFSSVQPSMKRKPLPEAIPRIKVDTNESRGGPNAKDPNFDSSRPQTDRDLDPLNLRSPRSAQEHNIKLLQKMGIESTHLKKMGDDWRHQVTELVKGDLHYNVEYLGTSQVNKFEGPKTTEEACNKMKMMASKMQKVPKISLWIHGSIVKFVDSTSQSVMKKDEMKTILYIAQDVKDPTVFGYVTRDPAQRKLCFCHVLRAPSKKVANEVVMTLGQAFEIAYQHHKKTKAIQKMTAFEQDLEKRRDARQPDEPTATAGAATTDSAPNRDSTSSLPRGATNVASPAYSKVIPKRMRRQASDATEVPASGSKPQGDTMSDAPPPVPGHSGRGQVAAMRDNPPPPVPDHASSRSAKHKDNGDDKWIMSSLAK